MLVTPHVHTVTPDMAARRRETLSLLPSGEIVGATMIADTFSVEIAPVDGASPKDIETYDRICDEVRDLLGTVHHPGCPIRSEDLTPLGRQLDTLQHRNGVHLYGALRNQFDQPDRLIFLVALAPGLHYTVNIYR